MSFGGVKAMTIEVATVDLPEVLPDPAVVPLRLPSDEVEDTDRGLPPEGLGSGWGQGAARARRGPRRARRA